MNQSIHEPGKKVPVILETDLVVVGGSCTGVFAAVRAARLGLRVAIVEKHNCFGGAATAGLVNVWHSLLDTTGERRIIGGLTGEVLERLRKRSAIIEQAKPRNHYRLNTEELKIELDELVVENRIIPFLHTLFVAPVVEGDHLQAVIIENKNGRQALRAQQFIDATGDGFLARQLGVEFEETPPRQPPSSCAKIGGLNGLGDFNWLEAVRQHGPEFGLRKDWGWGGQIPGPMDLQFRADWHVFKLDTNHADQLTQAEIRGRRQLRAMLDLIRKYGPADGQPTLVDLAAEIGIRETDRIKGVYQVTGEDVLHGRRFEDAIAYGSYPVDIHHANGPGITFRYLDGTERIIPERGASPETGRWREPWPEDPTFYQIPFRCLRQNRIANLIMAGRMLCSDKTAFSALRVMVNLNQTGEAAGVACALACRQPCRIDQIKPAVLRETMAAGGSIMIPEV